MQEDDAGEALTAFAKKKEYDEEVIRNPEIIEAAAASVNEAADEAIAERKKRDSQEAISYDIKLKELV